MEEEYKYLRIGTSVYKVISRPTASGEYVRLLTPWSYSALAHDEGREYASNIPKYDGFCTMPEHVNYSRNIGTFYNLYEPITHQSQPGEFPHIEQLVKHIFGEQHELGMDYLQLLYLRPVQKLPILLLVSEERNTGKTTFLNFLKAIFQSNVTFNTNEDFRSKFNSDWAGKLIIAVDEVLLDRREDAERLKNLSTARRYKMEAKGKDRQEVDFFGKFVLCSNNETFPIFIDREETRYWVRKVTPLEHDDTDFLRKLESEIPAFLHHLQHRAMTTTEQSRMWFRPEDIHTEALERIIKSCRSKTELDMAETIQELMTAENVETLMFCKEDLKKWMEYFGYKVDMTQMRTVLRHVWKLPHADNAYTYTTYEIDYMSPTHFREKRNTGRYYTLTKDKIGHLDC